MAPMSRFCPTWTYRVFFCRAAELALAWWCILRFDASDPRLKNWSEMDFNRLRYHSREVAIAVAITLAAVAALVAALSNREDEVKPAQPLALVAPKR